MRRQGRPEPESAGPDPGGLPQPPHCHRGFRERETTHFGISSCTRTWRLEAAPRPGSVGPPQQTSPGGPRSLCRLILPSDSTHPTTARAL